MILPASSCKDKDSSELTFASTSRPRKTTKYVRETDRQRMLVSYLNLTSSYYYNSAGVTVAVSCCILILLFALQHIGTHRVSFLFAPIILAWLFCNSTIGLYNLFNHNLEILRAVSPYYMYNYFKVSGQNGWISLGGVLLCITGR